jgi:hypothetical protein
MSKSMNGAAPELSKASTSMAGSMMGEMLKKFWWIPVLSLTIIGLFIWGIVTLLTA